MTTPVGSATMTGMSKKAKSESPEAPEKAAKSASSSSKAATKSDTSKSAKEAGTSSKTSAKTTAAGGASTKTTTSDAQPKKKSAGKASKKSSSSKKSADTTAKSDAKKKSEATKKSEASAAKTAATSKTAEAEAPTAKGEKKAEKSASDATSEAKNVDTSTSTARLAPAKVARLKQAEEVIANVGRDEATRKGTKKFKAVKSDFASALRVGEGFVLADLDASSTPAFDGGPKKAEKVMRKTGDELADLQERLYASERHPGGRSVLLLVQGMDTSGKGGIMRHVVGTMDPQGVELTAFKTPTKEEQAHPFLWRIRNALPKPGYVGVFDRSQYEDVLVVRVHDLVSRPVWMRRYGQINAFEESVVANGTTIIKVMLHISADEQKARLAERLEDPEKFYKFNPGDLVERSYWSEYQEAYQALLEKTSTDVAPWFVVPADNKWYARLAVQQLVLEHLRALALEWPEATFDVPEQRARLDKL